MSEINFSFYRRYSDFQTPEILGEKKGLLCISVEYCMRRYVVSYKEVFGQLVAKGSAHLVHHQKLKLQHHEQRFPCSLTFPAVQKTKILLASSPDLPLKDPL